MDESETDRSRRQQPLFIKIFKQTISLSLLSPFSSSSRKHPERRSSEALKPTARSSSTLAFTPAPSSSTSSAAAPSSLLLLPASPSANENATVWDVSQALSLGMYAALPWLRLLALQD